MVWFEAQPWGCTLLRGWWLLVIAGQITRWLKYFNIGNTGLKTEKFKFYKIQMLEKIE